MTPIKAGNVAITIISVFLSFPVQAAPPATPPVQTQTQDGATVRPNTPGVQLTPETRTDPLKTLPSTQPERVQQGLEIGSFLFRPEIAITEMYDDNIFATRTREVEDMITIISPTLSVVSNWDRHSLRFWAGADKDIYRSNSEQNVLDHWFETEGRFDFTDSTNVYGGAGISRNHEDRANLNDPLRNFLAEDPTRYWEKKAHVGAFHEMERVTFRLGTTYEDLDFDDVRAFSGAMIDMDDRDRKVYSAGGRISFKLTEKYQIFGQYASDDRRYDDNTVDRDSDGYRAAAGMSFDFGGNNTAEFYVGHLEQDYDNAAFADVSKPYFGAELDMAIGPSTYLLAFLDREVGETTLPGASSFLDTTVGFRVDHDVHQDFNVNGRLAYSRSEFQGIDRDEDYLDAGFGARYYVLKDVYIAGDYRLILRETNDNLAVSTGIQREFDFSKNQIFLSVGYTPGRKPRPIATANAGIYLAASDLDGLQLPAFETYSDYEGFYAGAQTGYGAVSSELFSDRGNSGTDDMDLGSNGGHTSGLFAGYGRMWNRWYYGLELEAETSSADWYHSKTKAEARTMSLEKNETYGLGLRLGYALQGALLYGRLGVVRTDFDAYDTENQFRAGAYDEDESQTGYRYGLGLDVPASEHVFLRMDYTFTRYDEFDAQAQANLAGTRFDISEFDTSESLFRVGLGWRFNNQETPTTQVDASIARGFYAGARAGYGVMNSDMDAIHNDGGGSPCVNCPFTGEFGDAGTSLGFFAGYGINLNRIYLGLELEAEASKAEWMNDRQTDGGGREFSVSKKGGYGAGIKVGYVLDNGTLVYAKAGQVRTRFNTVYIKGNNQNFWIDRDDKIDGDRFGIGAEVPAYRNLFVKVDYSVTDYDDYGFTTEQANADTVDFENKESLFSLGIGMRF